LHRCEELRDAIRRLEPRHRGSSLGHPTASFGVALFPDHAEDADSLINASDQALYQAKRAGRNCVVTSLAQMRTESPSGSMGTSE